MAAYYIQKDGGHFGPLSRDELQQYIAANVLTVEDWALEEGQTAWVPLGTYVQPLPEPLAVADRISANQTAEPSRRGMALAGVILLLVSGAAFGAWQIWGGKSIPSNSPSKHGIQVSILQPGDMPKVPPTSELKPLPTNNLPSAVPGELIFISQENIFPLQARAKAGDAVAMLELARRHETGWGARWDPAAAFKLLERAAAKDEPRARVLLAVYCMSGFGTGRMDVKRAARLEQSGMLERVRKMADAGDAVALAILGLSNKPRRGFAGNPELAYRQFRLAADSHDVQAQHWVGLMESTGVGTKRDVAHGARWIAAAAGRGQALSISLLGRMHLLGQGLPENSGEGVRLIRRAAGLGVPLARYRLGFMYLKGSHLEPDPRQACVWFLLAYEKMSMARPHLKKLRDEMDPAEYDLALAEAIRIDDTFTDPGLPPPDPNRPPNPPAIGKPVQPGVAELPPVLAEGSPAAELQQIFQGLSQGKPIVLWNALPERYQADVKMLLGTVGQQLSAEDHRRLIGVLGKMAKLMREKKTELISLAPEELRPYWDTAAVILGTVAKSELADPKWFEEPDVPKMLNGTGAGLCAELLKHKKLYLWQWNGLRFVPVSESGNEAVVEMFADKTSEKLALRRVDGKWLPPSLVAQWDKSVAAVKKTLGKPEVPNEARDAFLRTLGVLEQGLEQVNASENDEQFKARVKGLLKVLLPPSPAPVPEGTPSSNP